ncbi:hypothetical protein L210DRAFT_988086 [Boletus edulis BED1]|uniref:Uncharacterized protein n=1 Tax=Boletus edulis BED1 TaxID=1328754 RepID=A0AAD4GC97_BOLED|nr:hypothetical protein L210DRAFT_988086 [Boletus edulis BED1]
MLASMGGWIADEKRRLGTSGMSGASAVERGRIEHGGQTVEMHCEIINLAQGREDEDYVARRHAVDFALPLLNNAKCAALWVEALRRKIEPDGRGSRLMGYQEWNVPSEVKSWGGRHELVAG